MSQVRMSEKKNKRGLWPVIGLFLAVALGILAYFLAPEAIRFVRNVLPGFTTAGIAPATLRLIFTAILFVIFLALAAFIIALFAPKPKQEVTYGEVAKEREAMEAERRRKKAHQRKLAQEMREDVKKRQG